jgi:hypothetical protein
LGQYDPETGTTTVKMIDPGREGLIANAMLGGIISAVLGVVLTLMGFMGGTGVLAALGMVLLAGGIGAMVWSVSTGLYRVNKLGSTNAVSEATGVRVVARFAVNHLGEMLFDIDPIDMPELKYYVRLMFADGRQGEFKTVWEVFAEAGEGMYGDVAYQGDWLSRFTKRPAPPR